VRVQPLERWSRGTPAFTRRVTCISSADRSGWTVAISRATRMIAASRLTPASTHTTSRSRQSGSWRWSFSCRSRAILFTIAVGAISPTAALSTTAPTKWSALVRGMRANASTGGTAAAAMRTVVKTSGADGPSKPAWTRVLVTSPWQPIGRTTPASHLATVRERGLVGAAPATYAVALDPGRGTERRCRSVTTA
jgi:hypothetical protein